MFPSHRSFQDIWRATTGLIGPVCPHEQTQSISGGSRACVSSRRNPVRAHQIQFKKQTKSCMGTVGGFTSKSHRGSEAKTDVDAALDYMVFEEESVSYQSKALILAGVSACYFGTHYHLEIAMLPFGNNVQN